MRIIERAAWHKHSCINRTMPVAQPRLYGHRAWLSSTRDEVCNPIRHRPFNSVNHQRCVGISLVTNVIHSVCTWGVRNLLLSDTLIPQLRTSETEASYKSTQWLIYWCLNRKRWEHLPRIPVSKFGARISSDVYQTIQPIKNCERPIEEILFRRAGISIHFLMW